MIDVLPGGGHDADRPVAGGVTHQIEEMAAFLDRHSPGQTAKPVPASHLGQERKPVFTNARRFGATGRGVHPFEELGNRKHVAVFHRDPDRGCGSRRDPPCPAQLLRRGEQRFLDDHRFELIQMQVVRGCDQNGVERRVPDRHRQ